jgi:large repetitive protein
MMKNLLLLLVTMYSCDLFAQCNPNVPHYNANLTGHPDTTWISPNVSRNGYCCGIDSIVIVPPPRCISFTVTLDPQAIGLVFDINSGARPSGALYYQINCGPITPIGNPICLVPPGPFLLTFCKPGNNRNTYSIRSIRGNIGTLGATIREGCDTQLELNTTNIVPSSITWQDITSGTGLYNANLSCTSGCSVTNFTAPISGPPFVDYRVCGIVQTTVCQGLIPPICDTVRAFVRPPFTVTIAPAFFCQDQTSVTIEAEPDIPSGSYSYEWVNGANGVGTTIGLDSTLTVLSAGTYSVVIEDTNFGKCSRDTATIIIPKVVTNIIASANNDCIGSSVQFSASGGMSYEWSGPNAYSAIGSNPDLDHLDFTSTGTYTVVATDIYGCRGVANTEVIPIDCTEICGNGIDDDGDGLADVGDDDCCR